jgi:nitrogen fixation/metabolism regulation signal transduction histidine kinase
MVFKTFRVQIILRIVLLAAGLFLLAWCLSQKLFLRSVYIGAGISMLIVEMFRYIDRFNRDFRHFLISLSQHDFTTHYPLPSQGGTHDELYKVLNQITTAFKSIRAEKEIQHRFLEMLVEHIRVCILGIDEHGKIQLANQAVKNLLQRNVLSHLEALHAFEPLLVNTLRDIRSGETRLIKLIRNDEIMQLSIHASEFKLDDHYYKLVSMQNIRSELDAREMEAWQKLIRVLSHEIMNSVSPVISLSGTLHALVARDEMLKVSQPDLHRSLYQGLDAIKIRSEGLYAFTQSYRKLTGIPKPVIKTINLKEIIDRVQILIEQRLKEGNVSLVTHHIDKQIVADPALMEQVLINILFNALEAVVSREQPRIEVYTAHPPGKNIIIYISDNGEGMDERTAERIFIPFFTTRKNGTGIGLAITKQLLQLQDADIRFTTVQGEGTTFQITLGLQKLLNHSDYR